MVEQIDGASGFQSYASEGEGRMETVRAGETLPTLLARLGLSRQDLQAANPHLDLEELGAGNQIRIPSRGPAGGPQEAPGKDRAGRNEGTVSGDLSRDPGRAYGDKILIELPEDPRKLSPESLEKIRRMDSPGGRRRRLVNTIRAQNPHWSAQQVSAAADAVTEGLPEPLGVWNDFSEAMTEDLVSGRMLRHAGETLGYTTLGVGKAAWGLTKMIFSSPWYAARAIGNGADYIRNTSWEQFNEDQRNLVMGADRLFRQGEIPAQPSAAANMAMGGHRTDSIKAILRWTRLVLRVE